jgi:hypothetical protein
LVSYKEKEKWPFAKRVGHIRISSQDLVQLLGSCAENGAVSATSKRHTFSSLDDIKENLPLFFGEMELTIRTEDEDMYSSPVIVNLGGCATVGAYSQNQDLDLRIEKIAKELKHFRIPIFGYLSIVPLFFWVTMLGILFWLVPSPGEPMYVSIPWVSEKTNSYLLLSAIIISLVSIMVAIFPPVYYNPRRTFWQRNRDNIALAAISVLVGAALTEVLRWIVEVISK